MDAPTREDGFNSSIAESLFSISSSSPHSSLLGERRLSWLMCRNSAEDELLVSFNAGGGEDEVGGTAAFYGVASAPVSIASFLTMASDSIVTFWRGSRRERRSSDVSLVGSGPCSFLVRCFRRCMPRRNWLSTEEPQELMENVNLVQPESPAQVRSATAEQAVQVERNDITGALGISTELCSRLRPLDDANGDSPVQDGQLANSLRCHVLFSSPICIERAWTVPLPVISDILESEAEVLKWGLEFNVACPSLVECVKTDGHIAAFNMQQEHAECMVRPGDELWQVSLGSCVKPLQGQTAASTLQALLLNVKETRSAENTKSMRMGLTFRGLRAMKQLRVEREILALQDSGCEVQTWSATAENIRSLLATEECRILHLIFHSSAEQDHFIILEDRLGKAHVLRSSDLHRLLTGGQDQQNIALVFLNSCHSFTLGKHFIDAGVRHVICVRDEDTVRDESCLLFASHFFKALRAGKSVKDAFDCGVTVLECSQDADLRCNACAFVLLPEGGDHTEVFSETCRTPSFMPSPSCGHGGSWGALLPPVEDFLGRDVDMYRLLRVVDSRRYVEVHGEPGIGKTALLAEAGRFLHLRQEVFHEVRWVDHSEACMAGLEDLYLRLQDAPRRRVLLLIDTDAALAWPQVEAFLRITKNVHLLIACSGNGGGSIARPVAVAAGLKAMRFPLGPLDALAQAQLLLRRAGRPLFTFELQGEPGQPAPVPAQHEVSILHPHCPADFLALAGQPKLHALGGNPARIVAMAQQLSESPPPMLMHTMSASDLLTVPRSSGCVSQRRARLMRPDGKTKDEWLSKESKIADVIQMFAPREMRDSADIFIDGCRAQPSMPISSFRDDPSQGILVIEFRSRNGDDW